MEFEESHGEDIVVHIQRDRFGEAGRIAKEVLAQATTDKAQKEMATDITLRPSTGIPILLGVLALVFVVLVFVGGMIEGVLVGAYAETGRPFFSDLAAEAESDITFGILQGISLSMEAMLALVIPYILVFYIMLSVLEDTGYLVRVVSLLDGVMPGVALRQLKVGRPRGGKPARTTRDGAAGRRDACRLLALTIPQMMPERKGTAP